jgi:hypothetical protein
LGQNAACAHVQALSILRQLSKTSIGEIDSLIVELKMLHKKLQTYGNGLAENAIVAPEDVFLEQPKVTHNLTCDDDTVRIPNKLRKV